MAVAGWIIGIASSFLLGGILGGRVIGRLRGVDIARQGSGNIGTTNALRTQGLAFALAVLLIDAGKGSVAAGLIPRLLDLPNGAEYYCGAAAVLGHCFSPWHQFNGGKGVATLAGVFATLLPQAMPWMLLMFALVVMLTGMVSLATLAAAVSALMWVGAHLRWGLAPIVALLFTVSMTALVLYTHRENWRRVRLGTESRFERARVLGRLLRLP